MAASTSSTCRCSPPSPSATRRCATDREPGMKLTPIQKRAARNARHGNQLDMNLVSLIDVFTILIFFLLSNSGVETIAPSGTVHLPESTAKQEPKETVVVSV